MTLNPVRLGRSALQVSPICLGTMTFGEQVPEALAHSILDRSLERGIDFLDTAEMYAVPARAETFGATETILGNWFAKNPGARGKIVLASKVAGPSRGMAWVREGQGMTAADIMASCEGSLRRLQTDVIDLYQIHWPEPDERIEEGWTEINRLRTEGKVRWVGVSNFNAAQLERAERIAPVASLQPPYSMLRREIEPAVLPWCAAHRTGVIVYSPMQSGLLTGAWTHERLAALPADDWRRDKNRHFQEPLFSRNLRLVEVLRGIAARHGATPGQIALAWTLRHPAVTAAIVGARRAGQLKELLPAAGLKLAPEDLAAIDAFLAANPE